MMCPLTPEQEAYMHTYIHIYIYIYEISIKLMVDERMYRSSVSEECEFSVCVFDFRRED